MSYDNKQAKKSKNFSSLDRKVLLDLLFMYKHIIECKKASNCSPPKKEAAWEEICKRYNASELIVEQVQ